VLQGGRRVWGQTELLRGRLAMQALGVPAPARLLDAQGLLASHLAATPGGTWFERIDAQGRPLAGPVPATTLYHLVSMMVALAATDPAP
jgi:mannose/cellobiose epimerase-like protein (N-acyl-D-glucosamine 2-epimerase family)